MLKRLAVFALLLSCTATQALAQAAPPAKPAVQAAPAQGPTEDDKKRDADEKRAQAKLEQQKQAKAARDKLMSQCVIRPVMSDDDIAKCRAAYAAK